MPLWQGSTFYITAYIYNQMEIEQVKKDFGIDVFASAEDYIGHAIKNDPMRQERFRLSYILPVYAKKNIRSCSEGLKTLWITI